jgi:hypothetical protein
MRAGPTDGFNKRVLALALDPGVAQTVYAGVGGRAVWKTTDGGGGLDHVPADLVDPNTFAYAAPTAWARRHHSRRRPAASSNSVETHPAGAGRLRASRSAAITEPRSVTGASRM